MKLEKYMIEIKAFTDDQKVKKLLTIYVFLEMHFLNR